MQNPNPWPQAWTMTAVCLLIVLGCGAYVVAASQPERLKPVTSYAQFTAQSKAFACDYPTGWKVGAAEPQGIDSYAHFKKGTGVISVDADLQGSLQADIMRSSQQQMDNAGGDFAGGSGGGVPDLSGVPGASHLMGGGANDRRPPVERLHEARKEAFEEDRKDYQEQAATVIQSALGEGRLSPYTYKGDWGGKIKGVRVTILSNDKLVQFHAECQEPDFNMMKPAFDHVLQSLRPGT
jgi:hypothetical protein